jgi:hypothetical protein
MPTWERKTQFPQHYGSNPGHKTIQQNKEKSKLIQSPSRGPLKKKSKSKGKA